MVSSTEARPIAIVYEGAAAQPHAARLREMLASDIEVPQVKDETPSGGELGVGQLVVTIIATGLAKSVALVAIGHIRAFLKERIEAKDRGLRLRVDVRGAATKRIPFSLDRATLEAADIFCGQIEKVIGTLLPGTPSPGMPKAAQRKHLILFLAADPGRTSRLALDDECAAIERELRMAEARDDFDFRSKWAVSIDDMMRHLNELRPTIVHFSGHGGGSSDVYLVDELHAPLPGHRDIVAATSAGIQLQGEQRQPQYVSAHALSQMISTAAPSVRLVVLNACFSDAVAAALQSKIDCVVGMRGAIGDDAARVFSVGFYRALGYHRSIGNAVAQAVAILAARNPPAEHLPVCRTRNGINADHIELPSLIS